MSVRCIKSNDPSIHVTVHPRLTRLFFSYPKCNKMKLVVVVFVCCIAALAAGNALPERETNAEAKATDDTHTRNKRTLFLKKKLIGAGLLGFGLGLTKGLKFGHHGYPEVHHVYSAPPARYVEYVEKPVFVQRIVEKPVFKQSHVDYESWSPHETSYGSW